MVFCLIYAVVIFAATFLGAFVGLGGGVIIKPLLDLIGHDTIAVVNFISACAVFSMSITSTIKHIRAKTKIEFGIIVYLSIGAVVGGICGSKLFDYFLTLFNNSLLKSIQGLVLGILLVASVIYVNTKKCKEFQTHKTCAYHYCRFNSRIHRIVFGSRRRPYQCCVFGALLLYDRKRGCRLQRWHNLFQSAFKTYYPWGYTYNTKV